MRALLFFALAAFSMNCSADGRGKDWPKIQTFNRTFTFDSISAMHLRFPILDVEGRSPYIVACASPLADPKAIDDYAYSRDFECHVSQPRATTLPGIQLLALNAAVTKEWESRGGFWWSELTDDCKSNPYWGATRVFRFRHMRLMINVRDVKMIPVVRKSEHDPYYKLASLKVKITGRPDPEASEPFGGFSPEPEPRPAKTSEPYGYQECGVRNER